jgi:hypothetical protein
MKCGLSDIKMYKNFSEMDHTLVSLKGFIFSYKFKIHEHIMLEHRILPHGQLSFSPDRKILKGTVSPV